MEHIVNRLRSLGFIPTHRCELTGKITLRDPPSSVIFLTPVDGGCVAVDFGEAEDNWSDAALDERDAAIMACIRLMEPTAFLRMPSRRSYGRGGL